MMHQLIDNKRNFFFYVFIFLFLTTINVNNNNLRNFISFKLSDIKVEGISDDENKIIQQELNVFKGRNIFFLNKNEFKLILSKFNIVGSYEIKKIYPNKIYLSLKKTKFLAFTYLNNSKFIIGENKKLVEFKKEKYNNLDLPIVFTDKHYEKFVDLRKIIDETNFNLNEIESFYYFKLGRWDLKTKKGIIIKLPSKNLKDAIIRANAMINDKKLSKFNLLDMRINNYIITSNE